MPAVASKQPLTRLIVNGNARQRARTPNLQWDRAFLPGGAYNDHCDPKHMPKGGQLSQNCFGFVFNASDIPHDWDLSAQALGRWRVGAYQAAAGVCRQLHAAGELAGGH